MSEEKKETADTAATAAPAPDKAKAEETDAQKADKMKKKFGLKEIYRDRQGYWYSTKPEGAAGKDYTQY